MSAYERLRHEIKGVRDVVDAQDEVSIEAQVLVPLDDAERFCALVEICREYKEIDELSIHIAAALARVMEDGE